MQKRKTGLHKEVTSIFDGVPIPKAHGASVPDAAKYHQPKKTVHNPPTAPAPKQSTEIKPPVQVKPLARPKRQPDIKTPMQIPGKQIWEQIQNKLLASVQGAGNKRQRTMIVMIPILLVIFIVAFTRLLSASSPKTTGPSNFEPTALTGGSKGKINWQLPEPYSTNLRDPMQYGSSTTNQTDTDLIVKGIVYTEDTPHAVVGSQIVREGEKVSGATVVKIDKESVTFEMDGKRWTQTIQH